MAETLPHTRDSPSNAEPKHFYIVPDRHDHVLESCKHLHRTGQHRAFASRPSTMTHKREAAKWAVAFHAVFGDF